MEDAPVFRPTPSEFASFPRYIRTVVEPQCQAIGLCKIVPPAAWVARASGYDDVAFDIHTPLSQHVAGKKGVFNVDLVERKSMTLDAFKALAAAKDTIAHLLDDDDAIERTFWKGLRPTMEPPVYGADLVGSLFQDDAKSNPWNVNNLDTILRSVDLPGVTQAMLYFGMWRAMFALHTEDMDLYSINFLHTGRPKFWYGIPPQSAAKLERVAQSLFPEKDMTCHQFLRHKTSLIAPSKLREHSVPFVKVVQRPGEFVITFPGSYHQGFNMGYNIAESVNFATLRWVGLGRAAKVCR
ncbi:hypothetical protein SPRG_04576 [Saprolegnia parasitica CBS 223.65]|uniref:JmjC domain-containing protein n=1 Tax=Saprolegnia parasitica (strain CBS 223.65) TaxID=695850 RepID=A0A067CN99_SAPPC|nr:hypothetical protein SPRG_04576 [Saprolegnia parasitica CBS 223.65]KDO30675.1 hypothetical protein SPRG_04576 [Saprolegnia parasitica CBS 223.65]|eukprot:XP_012198379.1 hypothetical protein SPRG_04576 [Saprolegnia parasitica CBS 223.65]